MTPKLSGLWVSQPGRKSGSIWSATSGSVWCATGGSIWSDTGGSVWCAIVNLFVLLLFFTMPLRGAVSPLDAARVGRDFLILPVALLVFGFHQQSNCNKSLFSFFRLIGIITSIQIFINAINPHVLEQIFPALRAAEAYQLDMQRNYMRSKSMLFPHFLALIYFIKIIKEGGLKKDYFYFILFYLGSALQGFRAYYIVLTVVLLAVFLINATMKKQLKHVLIIFLAALVLAITDIALFNQQISGRFINTALELRGEREGTLQHRYNRDLVTMFPMFYEKPFWGWGFIYHSSEYGKQLGLRPADETSRAYVIYNIDSGYLTMLIIFGIAGVLLIMALFLKMFYVLWKTDNYSTTYTHIAIGGFVVLFVSLYTHGGFWSDFGLLPYSFTLGLMTLRSNKKYSPLIPK